MPGEALLAAWGRVVHRRRWSVLAASAVLLATSVAVALGGGTLRTLPPESTESGRALALLAEDVPAAGAPSFLLVFTSDDLTVDEPVFRDALLAAVAPLRSHAAVRDVATPYDPRPDAAALLGADGRAAAVVVRFAADLEAAREAYPALRESVDAGPLRVLATGEVAFDHDLNERLEADLKFAEFVSLPVVFALLVLVFGTLLAALLPVGVGALAVTGGVAVVLLLSRVADVSEYALNIVSLIGLGVAIDYSLFIVSRFREEARRGEDLAEALSRTLATAGVAVAFSGVTVAIGLAGLLFFRGSFLASMGVAGAAVVALAVLYALTFLPALLAVLGPRVAKWKLHQLRRAARPASREFWRSFSMAVMRRPVLVLVPTLAFLLLLGAPFLGMTLATSGAAVLPADAEAREGHELLVGGFPAQAGARLALVVRYPDGDPLAPERVGGLHDLGLRVAAAPGVVAVRSVAHLDPAMTREDHVALYSAPREAWPPEVAAAVAETVGSRTVVVAVHSAVAPGTPAAGDLVRAVRDAASLDGAEVLVTGAAAVDVDTTAFIVGRAPAAIAFVVAVTYVLIFVQVRSVVIPAKAIVMNLLSLTASFGALVWIFQDGNLSGLLRFTPQPIDPTLPVILFCTVFGLSMDYEVLLLSRMHEEYERTGDNVAAVAGGLQASGRLITGAAAIMVVVFGAFALSGVVVIKAVGLGLAIAIAVDSTLVRALVVPSAMRLMGDANWWAPRWLARERGVRVPVAAPPTRVPVQLTAQRRRRAARVAARR